MMKSFAILLALALYVISPAAHARTHASPATKSDGVGLMFGEPTGLTAKFWRDEDQAIDAGLAFSLSDFVLLQSDYLWHFHGLFGEGTRFLDRLEPYLGA